LLKYIELICKEFESDRDYWKQMPKTIVNKGNDTLKYCKSKEGKWRRHFNIEWIKLGNSYEDGAQREIKSFLNLLNGEFSVIKVRETVMGNDHVIADEQTF
jgi:hypothetical protein